jgi:nucleoside-diphosphate-sugar epimerase
MAIRIAVTGASGFAGQHLLATLVKRNCRLRVLVRDPRRVAPSWKAEVITGDVRQRESLDALVRGCDAVIHLAGATAARSKAEFQATNTIGTAELVDAARKAGIPRFIHVSSLSARNPQLSPYGASKFAAEEFVSELKNSVIVRPPAVYGPGDRGVLPLIRQLIKRVAFIPGREKARFSLLYVTDLAEILAGLVEDRTCGVHDAHDGTRDGYNWTDIVQVFRTVEGRPNKIVYLPRAPVLAASHILSPLLWASPRPPLFSPGKVKELYHDDWVCQGGLRAKQPTPFRNGIVPTLAWYRQNRWLPQRRKPAESVKPLDQSEPVP